MKRLILSTLCLLASLTLLAQGKVSTRSYRLADFTDKVTKVVLSGDEFLNSALRQEVVNRWTASPFEFCTLEEFDALKLQEDYYFLIPAATRFKGEPEAGIVFLSLLKGGPEAAGGMSEMYEVLTLPLVPADGGNGRELVFTGALIKAIQDFTLAAMESEKVAYSRDGWFNGNYAARGKMMQIYMAREDLAVSLDLAQTEPLLDEDFHICDAEEADIRFLSREYNTLVSYTVSPVDPSRASYSYQLLFESGTETLFYLTRHRIRPKSPAGFLPDDMKWLLKRR